MDSSGDGNQFKYFALIISTTLLVVFVLWGGAFTLKTAIWVSNTNKLVADVIPYERTSDGSYKVLVLGDSLAYGVGNSSPENSFSGLLGKEYPKADIVNKAGVGDIVRDLALAIVDKIDQKYDVIIIIVGGNDIVHYGIDLEESKEYLKKVYEIASRNAEEVFTITSGDFNNVTLVPVLFRDYFAERSKIMRDFSIQLSGKYENITYVDAYDLNKNVYASLEASDHIHLNDKGTKKLFEIFLSTKNSQEN